MAQYVGPYRVEDLCNDLKLTNNGYLFAPTRTQLNVAEDNPFLFSIIGGTIYFQTKAAQQLKGRMVPMVDQEQQDLFEDADYEALVMSNQSDLTFGD